MAFLLLNLFLTLILTLILSLDFQSASFAPLVLFLPSLEEILRRFVFSVQQVTLLLAELLLVLPVLLVPILPLHLPLPLRLQIYQIKFVLLVLLELILLISHLRASFAPRGPIRIWVLLRAYFAPRGHFHPRCMDRPSALPVIWVLIAILDPRIVNHFSLLRR